MSKNSKIEWTDHTFNPFDSSPQLLAGRLLDGREWNEFPKPLS